MHISEMNHAAEAAVPSPVEAGRSLASPLLRPVLERWQRYALYRRTVSELNACTNRDLNDLGIYRGDIERIAREAAYGCEA